MTENGQQQSEQNGKYHPLHDDLSNIDDSQTPAQPSGVWAVLGMIANRLKTISGRSTWQDAPPTNLTEAHDHQQNKENPHGVTRAQLGAAAQTALDSHTAARDNPHGVTAAQAGARPATWVPGWNDVTSKPTTYPPSTHTHDYAPSSHVGSGGSAHPAATSSASGFITPAEKNKLAATGQYLEMHRVANQTLPSVGWHILSFDSEVADEMGWFSPSSPTVITPTVSCLVDVYLSTSYESNSTGSRLMRLWSVTRGISLFETTPTYGSVDSFGRMGLAGPVKLQANEQLRVEVYTSVGGIYAGDGGSAGRPRPQIRMVRFT